METKTVAAVGGAVLVTAAVLGLFVYDRLSEERPPIRVKNKKLVLESGKDWKKDKIGEQWKPNHSAGGDVSRFEVTTLAPTCATFTGKEIVLIVMIGGSAQEFRFYPQTNLDPFSVDFGDSEPKFDSPQSLEPDATKKTLKIKGDPELWISKVLADGQEKCSFAQTEPRVDLELRGKP